MVMQNDVHFYSHKIINAAFCYIMIPIMINIDLQKSKFIIIKLNDAPISTA